MPTLELEFEAYCNICNAGMCGNVEARRSRTRGHPQITIDPCARCIESAKEEAKDSETERMQALIDELEEELQELKSQNESA